MSVAWYFPHAILIVQKISTEYIPIRYFINLSKDIKLLYFYLAASSTMWAFGRVNR